MSKILVVATHGTDEPTRATAAFVTTVGAIGAGQEVAIALLMEAAYLVKEGVAQTVHGVGFPPLVELIEQVKQSDATVYV